ncbi:MAG: VanZ family protein [Lachnospiraceae bacterium]
MLFSALKDIWEAFQVYWEQALSFGMAGAAFYTAAAVLANAVRKKKKQSRYPFWLICFRICVFTVFSIYFSYLISLTLSGREAGSRTGYVNLVLFSTLIRNGRLGLNAVENILLFLPFGILVPVLWRFFRQWWSLVLMAFITSMLIELTQLLTARGFFELDDILLNTIGAFAGYLVFVLFYYSLLALRRRAREETLLHLASHPGGYSNAWSLFFSRAALVGIQLLPMAVMLLVIFGFSSDTGEISANLSGIVTEKIVRIINRMFSLDMTYEEVAAAADSYELYVRKGAHMTEYALLALSAAVFLYCRRLKAGWTFLITELLVLFVAIFDEWYQTGVSGRHGSNTDVLIDCTGALLMLLFLWLCLCLYRRSAAKKTVRVHRK